MVRGELTFEAVLCEFEVGRHNPCIIDQYINIGNVGPAINFLRSRANRIERTQIKSQNSCLEVGKFRCQVVCCLLQLANATTSKNNQPWLGYGDGFDKKCTEAPRAYTRGKNCLALDDRGIFLGELVDSGFGGVSGHGVDW
ncbi:hypothetical protein HG530_014248 [Fusarium avenaceum]|nr:hypothetical protein HG530_014248 [Fusarium avenaceum]